MTTMKFQRLLVGGSCYFVIDIVALYGARVFLPERPKSVQLSPRTGSALLQMSEQPFRGHWQGCEAQCRGYRVRMKGDFVPHELLQKTRTTQRSGVAHSLCTSAITPT